MSQEAVESVTRSNAEVKHIIIDGYETAKRILEENSEALTRIAEALLEREVLDAEQIQALSRGESLPDPAPNDHGGSLSPEPCPETSESSGGSPKAPRVLPQPGDQPA